VSDNLRGPGAGELFVLVMFEALIRATGVDPSLLIGLVLPVDGATAPDLPSLGAVNALLGRLEDEVEVDGVGVDPGAGDLVREELDCCDRSEDELGTVRRGGRTGVATFDEDDCRGRAGEAMEAGSTFALARGIVKG
jgi:hypothetical protein